MKIAKYIHILPGISKVHHWLIVIITISLTGNSSATQIHSEGNFKTACYIYTGPLDFNPDDIKNEDNWYPVGEGIMPYMCPSTGFLGGICYNDDGQYATLQVALNDLTSTGAGGGGLTSREDLGSVDGSTFPNTTLTLYQFDLP